jgi:TolB-like protein/DNA-binding winged helix-turn-helix (wHTH) protein/Tfp pilus assembly protein PilF
MSKTAEKSGRRYAFADVLVDTGRRTLVRRNERVALPRLTYRLLVALLEASPNVLSHDDLVDNVWQGRITSPETIKQRVKLLRDALGDDAANPVYVGLVRGQGYCLLPQVAVLDSADSADAQPHALASAPRWRRLAAGCVALLVMAAVGVYAVRDTPAPSALALAVLPFATASGDEAQAYVADGISDALIFELAARPDIDVVARASSMRYRDASKPLSAVGAELAVNSIVAGSVQWDGDQVLLEVQLSDAASERTIWSERYELRVQDIPVRQAEIAAQIMARLGVADAAGGSRPPRTVDPRTYEAYLRGMYHLQKATPAEIEQGLAYLHDAVDADPGDALAYAGLALGYATYGHGLEPRHDVWPRARAAALRALTLDPTLAEAHAALADVKLYSEWDWSGAEQAFQRANALNPSLAMNHYHYAWYLALFGRFEEAIAEHERAQRLDPLTPLHTLWLGALYLYQSMDRYPEAIATVQTALEMDPDNPTALLVLGLAQSAGGMHEQAVGTVELAAMIAPAIRAPLGLIYSLAGRDADAVAILAELEGARTTPWSAYWQVVLNARLGNLDKAFEWLEYEPHHAFVPWVRVDPWVRRILDQDPRFFAFLDRIGLEP